MPTPGGIDVSHCSKGRLHPARHLFQEHIKVGHFLLVDDNAAPREERVPVAIHQHALHARLREPRRLCARAGHAAGRASCAAPAARTWGRGYRGNGISRGRQGNPRSASFCPTAARSHKGRAGGGAALAAQRPHRALAHPGDEKPLKPERK
uniref:Uncharacterized protein n=1 Tax=Geospiza parvula TaxID=87175 RepID=A0A8U8AX09_GEOPR